MSCSCNDGRRGRRASSQVLIYAKHSKCRRRSSSCHHRRHRRRHSRHNRRNLANVAPVNRDVFGCACGGCGGGISCCGGIGYSAGRLLYDW